MVLRRDDACPMLDVITCFKMDSSPEPRPFIRCLFRESMGPSSEIQSGGRESKSRKPGFRWRWAEGIRSPRRLGFASPRATRHRDFAGGMWEDETIGSQGMEHRTGRWGIGTVLREALASGAAYVYCGIRKWRGGHLQVSRCQPAGKRAFSQSHLQGCALVRVMKRISCQDSLGAIKAPSHHPRHGNLR